MGYYDNFVTKNASYLHGIFRILVGLLFFLHGYGKLFGGNALPITSLIGLAGFIEFLAGLGIFFGFFTRLAATGGLITMIVAYFKMHASGGISPLVNGGELAVLFFAAFLILLAHGNGRWSLENRLLRKEVF